MIDALRYELVRLRTVKSTYWLIGLALLVPVGVCLLVGLLSRGDDLDGPFAVALMTGGSALFPLPIPAVMVGIIGVLSIGHEYRHTTIRPTLTAIPRRSAVVSAKLLVIVVTAVLVAVLNLVLTYLVLLVTRGEAPEIDDNGRGALLGFVVLLIIYGVIGFGATLLTRQTALVLPALFVLPLVIEPTIYFLTFIPALNGLEPATRFLPFSAGAQLAQSLPMDELGLPSDAAAPLSRVENGLVFAAFSALILAPAWLLFEKRDA